MLEFVSMLEICESLSFRLKVDRVAGLTHHGNSQPYYGGDGGDQRFQQLDVNLGMLPRNVHALYFFLSSPGDMGTFTGMAVELSLLDTDRCCAKQVERAVVMASRLMSEEVCDEDATFFKTLTQFLSGENRMIWRRSLREKVLGVEVDTIDQRDFFEVICL